MRTPLSFPRAPYALAAIAFAESSVFPIPPDVKRINFERLYSNWHAAMAAYNNPDGPDDDEHKDALAAKRDEAVLDYLVTTECLNVVPLALGAIRADLLRLGIG
jgi:hypothetical protein